MICMLISLVLIVAYIVYAISVMQGIPWSVSDTYYQLDKRGASQMAIPSGYDCPGFFTSPRMAGCVSCEDTVSRFPFRRRAYFCRRCALL